MTEDHQPSPLGELLKGLRKSAELSLYELAKRSGVARNKLLLIERGEIRQPTTATLNKLAAALGIDPEDFYDAVWQDTNEPLPSPAVYLRTKYHQLSDEQVAELESMVKRVTAETDDAP